MKRISQPQGIIKTLPIDFFDNYKNGGLSGFEKSFMGMNIYNYHWIFSLPGKPKYDVLYFYLLFNGAIRYRANIIGYEQIDEAVNCADGSSRTAKIWVQVSSPIIKANPPITMKGFQGFRYTEMLF